jgi:RING finger protein 26
VQQEQRLCVVCHESEKTVLLLPCRHLCVCQLCSQHDGLDACPLCRQAIAEKLDVYA